MNEAYFPPRLSGFFVFLLSFTIFLSSIIFVFFKQTTQIIPSQSPITAPSPVVENIYTTQVSYNLPPEVLNQLPTLTLGNIQFTYPQTWSVQDNIKPSIIKAKSDVVQLGIYLTKSNLSNDLSAPDEPTKNLVIIDFSLKNTKPLAQPLNISLREMMTSFFDNFSYGQNVSFSYLISEGTVSGLPAQFLYRSLEEVENPQLSYPERILVAVSPTTVLDIEIGFFDFGKDKTYSRETTKEINKVLNSIKIIKNSSNTQADTSSWKIYSDELQTYQIQAPADWEWITHSSNFQDMHFITLKAPDGSIFQGAATEAQNQTLTSYLKDMDQKNATGWEGQSSKKILASKNVSVGSIPGIERQEQWLAADYTTVVTYLKAGNFIFDFSIQPSDVPYSDSEVYQNYGQILSTFKFLGKPTPVDMIKAEDVYLPGQLSDSQKEWLKGSYWPKLKPFKSGDKNREIYLVDCEVTNTAWKFTGYPTVIENAPNPLEITLKKLVELNYGGFPDTGEIKQQTTTFGAHYINTVPGINGLVLRSNGTLDINFYDSVAAYGGGSSRVSCMYNAVDLTAKQFPNVKSVIMCINQYPNAENKYCAFDFQP